MMGRITQPAGVALLPAQTGARRGGEDMGEVLYNEGLGQVVLHLDEVRNCRGILNYYLHKGIAYFTPLPCSSYEVIQVICIWLKKY